MYSGKSLRGGISALTIMYTHGNTDVHTHTHIYIHKGGNTRLNTDTHTRQDTLHTHHYHNHHQRNSRSVVKAHAHQLVHMLREPSRFGAFCYSSIPYVWLSTENPGLRRKSGLNLQDEWAREKRTIKMLRVKDGKISFNEEALYSLTFLRVSAANKRMRITQKQTFLEFVCASFMVIGS